MSKAKLPILEVIDGIESLSFSSIWLKHDPVTSKRSLFQEFRLCLMLSEFREKVQLCVLPRFNFLLFRMILLTGDVQARS